MRISAEDEKGVKAAVVRELRIDRQTNAFLLRTDQAVYNTGDTVKLDIFAAVPQAETAPSGGSIVSNDCVTSRIQDEGIRWVGGQDDMCQVDGQCMRNIIISQIISSHVQIR